MTITITPEQLPAYLEALMRHRLAIAREVALDVVLRGEASAVRETVKKGRVNLGEYKRGWDHRILPDGAELFNDAPHAAVMEYGRRPMRPGPPLAPILDWVLNKLVPNGVVEEWEADDAAFLIRRAIHRRGLPPNFILRDQHPKMLRWYKSAIHKRFKR